jgi:hypothetical protein
MLTGLFIHYLPMLTINRTKETLDWEVLVKTLEYDIDTGIFTNKITRSNCAKVGEVAGNTDSTDPTKYSEVWLNGKHYPAHRLAWFYCFKEWPSNYLDHIDGNKSNNALNNLRECTGTENSYNVKVRKDNSVGYKGVSLDRRTGRYRAYITVDKKQKSLGYYNTPEEASKAYIDAAKELHGTFYNENTICS